MKAWQLENFGLHNLKQVELEKPEITEDQILIKVNSVSLNYRDTAIVEGIYTPELLKFPFIPITCLRCYSRWWTFRIHGIECKCSCILS